jgi:hypothetical protein
MASHEADYSSNKSNLIVVHLPGYHPMGFYKVSPMRLAKIGLVRLIGDNNILSMWVFSS